MSLIAEVHMSKKVVCLIFIIYIIFFVYPSSFLPNFTFSRPVSYYIDMLL